MTRRVTGSRFILGVACCLLGSSADAQETGQPDGPPAQDASGAAADDRTVTPATLERLFDALDRDASGAIALDEVPESLHSRLQPLFDRLQTDSITRADLERLSTAGREAAPPRPRTVPFPAIRGPAIFRVLDESGDGRISREELSRAGDKFDELDEDENGAITPDELFAMPGGDVGSSTRTPRSLPREETTPSPQRQEPADSPDPDSNAPATGEPATDGLAGQDLTSRLFARYDQDGDGHLSREESPGALRQHFDRFDNDGDGQIARGEFEAVVSEIRQSRTVDSDAGQVNGRPAPPPAPLAGAAPRRAAD